MLQEGQQIVAVVPQVLGEGLVGGIGLGRINRVEQKRIESAATNGQAMIAQFARGVAITQIQRMMQQFADAAWKTDGAARGGFEQFIATPQQMAETLLMDGVGKVVVRRPAVVNHDAGVVTT